MTKQLVSVSHSPVPRKQIDFCSALSEAVKGKKIHKLEWKSKEEYGFIKDEKLYIHRNDADFTWLIRTPDIIGKDYIVID